MRYFITILLFITIKSFAQKSNFEKGLESFNKANFQNAISFYSQELKTNKNSNVYFNRASAYFELEQYTNAIEDFTLVIDKDPIDYDAWYKRASSYYHLSSYQKAISDAKKALSINPKHYQAYNLIGLSNYSLKKYGISLENFNILIENKKSAQYYFNRALTYEKLELPNKSLLDFEKAISLKKDAKYFIGRANFHYNNKDYKKAQNDFSFVIIQDSTNSMHFYNRALSYYADYKNELALADFEKVVELNNTDIEAKWYIAICNYELKNYEESLKYYHIVETQDPSFKNLNQLNKNELTNKITLGNYFWYIVILILLFIMAILFGRKLFIKS